MGRSMRTNEYRVDPTRDGLVAVAGLSDRLRRALRDAVGVEDRSIEGTVYDPGGATAEQVMAVKEAMEAGFRERSSDEWLELLDSLGVPAAPFNLTEELYDDPHVVANDLIPRYEHRTLGTIRTARSPVEMSESSSASPRAAPVLGADTASVLAASGVADAEQDALEADGVIVRWRPPGEDGG